jgi:plastocyanin
VFDQTDASHVGGRRRWRVPAILAASGVALSVAASGLGLSAASTSPVMRGVSLAPASVGAAGGTVKVKAIATHASFCILSASPRLPGLPRTLSCGAGRASLSVRVPANTATSSRRYLISVRAARGRLRSKPASRWLSQAGAQACASTLHIQTSPKPVIRAHTNWYIFIPDTLCAPAGTVTIVMTNESSAPQSVAIQAPDATPGMIVSAQGQTSTTTATLGPGTYVYYSTVPGYRQAGTVGLLTVK